MIIVGPEVLFAPFLALNPKRHRGTEKLGPIVQHQGNTSVTLLQLDSLYFLPIMPCVWCLECLRFLRVCACMTIWQRLYRCIPTNNLYMTSIHHRCTIWHLCLRGLSWLWSCNIARVGFIEFSGLGVDSTVFSWQLAAGGLQVVSCQLGWWRWRFALGGCSFLG
jgi:hypothetical protein